MSTRQTLKSRINDLTLANKSKSDKIKELESKLKMFENMMQEIEDESDPEIIDELVNTSFAFKVIYESRLDK